MTPDDEIPERFSHPHRRYEDRLSAEVRLAVLEVTQAEHQRRIDALEDAGRWNLRFTVTSAIAGLSSALGIAIMLARGH